MWRLIEHQIDRTAWIMHDHTGEAVPCDDSFDTFPYGKLFPDEEVQVIPVPPVGVARLKYFGI